ncbi:hypothetical protein C1646_754850 [Rhizophagus diaphanus]|nr:hypothetical protein C1646_754850 [Rhizophagus diaphanus] [Rhizophagus sp. MUCL 43196]
MDLILQNPNLICNIRNLNLNVHGIPFRDLIPLLKFLYSNCNSISTIIFKFPKIYFNIINNYSLVEDCLSQMIFSQHNLKKISFGFFHNLNLYNPFLLLKNSNCSNTLNTIVFYFIDFKDIINILRSFKYYYEPSKRRLYEFIMKNCKEIRYFYTNVFDNNDIYLIIKNNQHNINYLTIVVKYYENNTNYNKLSSTVLKNLGQILPSKLEYLRLVLLFNTSNLEIFLKNSQNTFINELLIRNIEIDDINILYYI